MASKIEMNSETEVQTSPEIVAPAVAEPRTSSAKGLLIVLLVVALVIGYVVVTGLHARAKASTDLEERTDTMAIPTVSTIRPKVTGSLQEVVAPGNMQAFTETPIWARSNGYLKAWYVDIGAHVHTGQLLAEIESREIDQQLQQTREELLTAKANLKLAEITAERYNGLFKTDSVAKQDVDNAVQDAAAKSATVKSAEANVRRLEQLVSYEKIYAPFDGVVTARSIDVGALVDAGANATGRELFHIAATNTLRVYVSVPETYSQAAKPGVKAILTLGEFPGREFYGTVVRNSDAIDPASRTLLVEVDVKNSTGELLPGSYVSVHLKMPSRVQAVTVPSNVLLFRSEGLRVAVVRNGRVELVPVTIGHDFGEDVELVSGIHNDDDIIVDPSDSISQGQQVHVMGKSS